MSEIRCFQFLGIPPKGERHLTGPKLTTHSCFQFLGIPPKGELAISFYIPVSKQ